MHRRARVAIAGVAVTVVLAASSVPAAASVSPVKRARFGARFLIEKQSPDGSFQALSSIGSTADAVVSLVAVQRGPGAIRKGLAYLESNESEIDTIGEMAKVVLALTATGADPRSFGGRDLVTEMELSQQLAGRYGATTSVFGHALALLALEAASAPATLPAGARWLVDAQCSGGGWQYLEPSSPAEDDECSLGPLDIDRANTDTTAVAVQALEAMPAPIEPAHDPFAFFELALDGEHGGWGYGFGIGTQTNTNSTAMVLQAYAAADVVPPATAEPALARLQGRLCGRNAGGFYYTWGDQDGDGDDERIQSNDLAATIAALPGLLNAPLPQERLSVTKPPPRPRSCVG